MSVLHPTLLAAGLAAIALPILIHLLLRRRYTPIRWAAMRFVVQAHKQQRRRRRLEQILLLIARCLLVAMIAIAVAHPLLGSPARERERTVVIILDNGLASQTSNDDGSAELDRSKRLALEEIDRLRAAMGDRVAVISSAAPARAVIGTPTGDLDAARVAIEGIEPADSPPDLTRAFALADAAVRDGDGDTGNLSVDATVLVLSGWRVGSLGTNAGPRPGVGGGDAAPGKYSDAELEAGSGVSDLALTLAAPVETESQNLRIRDVTIPRGVLLLDDTPAVRQAIVRIDRTGPASDDVSGELICEIRSGDGFPTVSDPIRFVIAAGARETTVAIAIPVPTQMDEGAHNAASALFSLKASSRVDSIARDSVRRTAIRVARGVEAGLVRSRGIRDDGAGIPSEAWISAALRPDETSPVRVREIAHSGLDAASLIGLDLVVLARPDLLPGSAWSALRDFVDAGGSLLVFTPSLEGAQAWVDTAIARMPELEGLAREGVPLERPEPLVIGDAAGALGLLGAELADLAGAVRISQTLPMNADATRVVLAAESGAPVLVRPAPGVWVMTSAISPAWSDLAARPIFPALMQEVARQSPSRGVGVTVAAGEPVALPPRASGLASQESNLRVDRESWTAGLPRAGVYDLSSDAGDPMGLVAVNANTDAGDTAIGSQARVEASLVGIREGGIRWLGDESSKASEARFESTELALWAFALAVLLAVIESLIAASAIRRQPNTGMGTGSDATRATRAGSDRRTSKRTNETQRGAAA